MRDIGETMKQTLKMNLCLMKRNGLCFCLIMAGLFLGGCETAKCILGVSTKKLEEAVSQGITRTYACSFDDGFNAILDLGQSCPDCEPKAEKAFDVFLKNRIKGVIVVMGIPNQVDTTEVGIFLTEEREGDLRIDVSSLSTSAKEKVAEAVFQELDRLFQQKTLP
jgi:hypothetical protein